MQVTSTKISSVQKSGERDARPFQRNDPADGIAAVIRRDTVGRRRSDATPGSALRLTPASPPVGKKRPRPGGKGESTSAATLEEVHSGVTTNVKVTHTVSNVEGTTSVAALVDCLARYDPERGCYVLEMVDMLIETSESDAAECRPRMDGDSRNMMGGKQSGALMDPRSVAKRAEDQVKKMKRGRGRAK